VVNSSYLPLQHLPRGSHEKQFEQPVFGQDLNSGPPEYERGGALTTRNIRSDVSFIFSRPGTVTCFLSSQVPLNRLSTRATDSNWFCYKRLKRANSVYGLSLRKFILSSRHVLRTGCAKLNLNNVNQLIFVMVKCGVLFEVRTEFLNNI
jgi:hypothetical protein